MHQQPQGGPDAQAHLECRAVMAIGRSSLNGIILNVFSIVESTGSAGSDIDQIAGAPDIH